MSRLLTKKIVGFIAALATALAMAGAPEASLAMSGGGGMGGGGMGGGGMGGGGQGQSFQGGGSQGGGHGGHGGGSHGSDHARDHSRDGDHRHNGDHHNADQFDIDHPQDVVPFGGEHFPAVETEDELSLRDGYYEDHRLEGIYASWRSWLPLSLFHPHFHGAGYPPPCVRRDVYNDIYQAC
jgi:hypothetical protein